MGKKKLDQSTVRNVVQTVFIKSMTTQCYVWPTTKMPGWKLMSVINSIPETRASRVKGLAITSPFPFQKRKALGTHSQGPAKLQSSEGVT